MGMEVNRRHNERLPDCELSVEVLDWAPRL